MVLPDASRPMVVYIAGLGHSGSTLLDLVLGSHSRLVGLGEVDRTLEGPEFSGALKGQSPGCACGEMLTQCPLWGAVREALEDHPSTDGHQRYLTLLQAMQSLHGRQVIAVDSSKNLRALDELRTHPDLDVRVIFLVRDVRSFTVSALDNSQRKRRTNPQYPSPSALATARDWYRQNRATREYLVRNRIPFMLLGYEELCMAPEASTRQLCTFLGLEWEPAMLDLANSRSHVARGNRMRLAHTRFSISYDWRWFSRKEWQMPWLFLPGIRRLNQELVYSHGLTAPRAS